MEAGAAIPTAPTQFGFAFGSWTNAEGVAVTQVPDDAPAGFTIQLSPDSVALDLTKDTDGNYEIGAVNDLLKLQAIVAASFDCAGLTFKQTENIDFTGADPFNGIGARDKDNYKYNKAAKVAEATDIFRGTYDGNNLKISNVIGDTSATDKNQAKYGGIFNTIENATIKNLTVENIALSDNTVADNCYSIVGVAYNSGLTNLTAQGTIEAFGNYGAIVNNADTTTIYGCQNKATITNYNTDHLTQGGICCYAYCCTFDTCSNSGVIHSPVQNNAVSKGTSREGGIVGANGDGASTCWIKFKDCSVTVVPTADAPTEDYPDPVYIGSFIGDAQNDITIQVEGTNTAPAGTPTVGKKGTSNVNAIAFATVDSDVATVAALEADKTFKVMAAKAKATYAFEAAGAITFVTNMFETTFAITVADTLDLAEVADANGVTFTATVKSTDPREANPQTPAEVETALGNLGVSDLAKANITTVEEFAKFDGYFKTKTQSQTWDQVTDVQKANAYLCYALNADAIPNAEITDDDVTIDSFANGVIEIAIEGVEAGDEVPAAMIAKVIDIIGNNALTEMTADKVQASGQATANGKVQVTVAPAEKITDTSKFFYRASVKK